MSAANNLWITAGSDKIRSRTAAPDFAFTVRVTKQTDQGCQEQHPPHTFK